MSDSVGLRCRPRFAISKKCESVCLWEREREQGHSIKHVFLEVTVNIWETLPYLIEESGLRDTFS